ncbi:MAG: 2-oxoacid:ferredoxin oxidoreductase subunit beta [Acidobacteriota bacterium]|jgi:2-oxoglutarate/2-oxoacid ferredoxin oxidoreductase subunit beta
MGMDYFQYLRGDKMPHIWCPGCGHGTIVKSILRAIKKLEWDQNDVVVVSGIGCSSRTPGYLDFNTLHTTHGRSLAFGTGIKVANPKLHVIAVAGDGDALAIGGNHFIHTCRRNIDMTLIVYNNNIYGMTGGQASPTTFKGAKGTTAPYGAIEDPFDVCNLAIASGATYVARALDLDAVAMDRLIVGALKNKGFSVVDAWTQCTTYFGRQNKWGSASDMMDRYKDMSYNVRLAAKMSDEDKAGKFPVGVLHQVERQEFSEQYEALIQRVQGRED